MRPDDRIRVLHMIEAAESAIGFASDRTRSDLDSDRMLLFALVRAVEIIGEAAAKVSDSTKAELADVPWGPIVAMRNRLINAYFEINHDVLWRTVTDELPPLLANLREKIES